MKWYFQPLPDGYAAEPEHDDDAPGLLGLPAALLERHGARILDPGRAVAVRGYPRPRPTVYRARTLLVPDHLLRDTDFIGDVNEVLRHAGMELVPPAAGRDPDLDSDHDDPETFGLLRQLPRPAVLVPLRDNRRPAEIDAWTALQTLRAATGREDKRSGEASAEREQVILDKTKVDLIGLEHLLVGSATITGSPIGGGVGGISGGPGNGGNAGGPGINDSYLFNGGDSRTPVMVVADPPSRRSSRSCRSRYGRRPVIAVLDTGIGAHPWLDVPATRAGSLPADGFVKIDGAIQTAIRTASQQALTDGDEPRQVIEDAWDEPVSDNRLIGGLNEALGHGTFIAGIIRQVAPDAKVLSVRVMQSDNVLNEGDIICGLGQLAKRIALAAPDDPAADVDVVSLSIGYYSESASDAMLTAGLWLAIKALLSLGVLVAVAAGNYASRRRFYPAAFALQPVPGGQVPVFSVGALDPNGAQAMFSNNGDWVNAWGPGACVVSTYPTDVDGSRTPELRIPVNREPSGTWPPGREALDPDDYSAGFAVWSGTSFSAPYAAAQIARTLLEGAAKPGAGLRLDAAGTGARQRRAVTACQNLPRRIEWP
jgi:Subtilase family